MRFGLVAPGSTGPEVEDWQQNLKDLGYDIVVSGVYDDGATWSATVAFKESVGLPANGVVDQATIDAAWSAFDNLAGNEWAKFPKKLVRMLPIEIRGRFTPTTWLLLGSLAAVAGYAVYRGQSRSAPRRRRR